MVLIRGAISGTHSLSEQLITAILDFKYGRSTKDKVNELFQEDLKSLISLQQLLAFPTVSTCSLGIEDLIRPFTRSLKAIKSFKQIGDLPIVRYHFTNTFYRRPTIIDYLPDKSEVISDDIHSLSDSKTFVVNSSIKGESKFKIVLPGPVTFATFIDRNEHSPYSYAEFIEAAGAYLALEVQSLPDYYTEIQFDEPSLVWNKISRSLRPAILNAYSELAKALKNRTSIVNTFFESSEAILSFLLELPINGIGIDFLKTNVLLLSDLSFENKILQAGIFESQNYSLDKNGLLNSSFNDFFANFIFNLQNFSPKEIVVSSTTGLEFLPRQISDQRLHQISQVVNKVKEMN